MHFCGNLGLLHTYYRLQRALWRKPTYTHVHTRARARARALARAHARPWKLTYPCMVGPRPKLVWKDRLHDSKWGWETNAWPTLLAVLEPAAFESLTAWFWSWRGDLLSFFEQPSLSGLMKSLRHEVSAPCVGNCLSHTLESQERPLPTWPFLQDRWSK